MKQPTSLSLDDLTNLRTEMKCSYHISTIFAKQRFVNGRTFLDHGGKEDHNALTGLRLLHLFTKFNQSSNINKANFIYLLEVENPASFVESIESISKYKGQYSHQLHNNVKCRSRGILERIPYSISHNSCLVDVRSLTLEVRIR